MKVPNGKLNNQERTISARKIDLFLEKLAETSNVTASAKEAELTTSQIYRKRIASPQFRSQWAVALREGYARLEADMLAEARVEPKAGKVAGADLAKARTARQRLALTLLAAHRKSVTGEAQANSPQRRGSAKADLVSRLNALRERYHALDDGGDAEGAA